MKDFIIANWIQLLVIIVAISILIILWKNGKRQMVKNIIYWLVCQAEQQFGSKTGDIKWSMVWSNLYYGLPWYVRLIFPKTTLEKYIEEAVQRLRKQLEDKEFNLLTHNQEVEQVIKPKVS